MHKTFKVCTYHVNCTDIINNTTDSLYKKIYELTTAINKKYCEIHNYNYSFDIFNENELNNFLDTEIFQFNDKWNITCIFKYQYLLEQLEKSTEDYIVYVEYDSCFCNDIKRIEDFLNNDINTDFFYACCNWSWDINDFIKQTNEYVSALQHNINDIFDFNKYVNTLSKNEIFNYLTGCHKIFFNNEGLYIIKNSEISKKILRAIVKYAPIFYDKKHICAVEGLIVQFIMGKECFIKHVKQLPAITQGHIYGTSNRYNEDNCLVCHNSSIDKNILYEFIKNNIIKNKYWSKYFN